MYGMMHRAIRQMVIDRAGTAMWDGVERELGVGPAEFISATVHPDTLTLAMMEAAAERLDLSMAECMRLFGQYWVHFAESGPYAAIMDFVGQDLPGFIENLDRMHMAVVAAMPDARVPGFALISNDGKTMVVRYQSGRQGLEPMVGGLLEGLLARFKVAGTVREGLRGNAGVDFVLEFAGP